MQSTVKLSKKWHLPQKGDTFVTKHYYIYIITSILVLILKELMWFKH